MIALIFYICLVLTAAYLIFTRTEDIIMGQRIITYWHRRYAQYLISASAILASLCILTFGMIMLSRQFVIEFF